MSSVWIGLAAVLGGWMLVPVGLDPLLSRWMHMQRG
jgi:hypothetical protein